MEPWLSGVFSLSESRGLSRVPIMLMSETVIFYYSGIQERGREGEVSRRHWPTSSLDPLPTVLTVNAHVLSVGLCFPPCKRGGH